MARHGHVEWNLPEGAELKDGIVTNAVLMDIRDELKKLNRLLHCHNFIDIPRKLDNIVRNTATKRKKRVKVSA